MKDWGTVGRRGENGYEIQSATADTLDLWDLQRKHA